MNTKKRYRTHKKPFKLNPSSFYKLIDGKKYQYSGTVPKEMEYDIIRIYRKHNLVLKVEPYFDKLKLWSRRL